MYQDLRNKQTTVVIQGKFIALNAYIRNEGSLKIKELNTQLQLEK